MKREIIMILVLFSIQSAAANKIVEWKNAIDMKEDITWTSYMNQTMKWGDRINISEWALGNFTVELTDLMKDATGGRITGALMTITGENKKSQVLIASYESQIVNMGEPFYDDEMKIYASISGNRTWSRELFEPNISVNLFLRGKPDVNLSYGIYSENPESNANINSTDSIQSNKLFYIQISLENKGNATLKDVLLDVNLTNFTFPKEQIQRQGMTFKQVGNSIVYDLNDLKVNATTNITVRAISTVTPINKTFFIPVGVTGRDNKTVAYTFRTEKQLIVKPFIEVIKQAGPYVNYSGTNVLYVGESFLTTLYIKNSGNQNVTVNLTDSAPDLFEYMPIYNEDLNWKLTIPSKSSEMVMYSIKPIKYKETIIIPKAVATFEFEGRKYNVDSNDIEVKMKGADLLLTKDVKIEKQSNGIINATITINVKNQGDQRVSLNINDTLHNNASLVNGTISRDNIFLEKNEQYSYSYEFSIPFEEKIYLPAAKGYFIDFRTYIEKDSSRKDSWRKIESNQPSLELGKPSPVITPENMSKENQGNTTVSSQVREEIRKTKLDILKNFLFEFIDSIIGRAEKPALPSTQPAVIKKVEETHSSFTWSLGWKGQEYTNASGGTWRISETPGSKVVVSFTGTSVALLYALSPERGIASVELDGKPYMDIDMYSPIPESGIKTIASGLENTQHTLAVTVSVNKNPSASGSSVVVDAIEITIPSKSDG